MVVLNTLGTQDDVGEAEAALVKLEDTGEVPVDNGTVPVPTKDEDDSVA